jgi:dihydrofolate reductase
MSSANPHVPAPAFPHFPSFIPPPAFTAPSFPFSIVAARCASGGFALGSDLPWVRIPTDSHFYHSVTSLTDYDYGRIQRGETFPYTGPEKMINLDGKLNAIIFGRNTWLAKQKRVASARISIVLTSDETIQQEIREQRETHKKLVYSFNTLNAALKALAQDEKFAAKISHVFVIGGAKLIEQCYQHPQCQHVYLTQLTSSHHHDVSLTTPPNTLFSMVSQSDSIQENGIHYSFHIFSRSSTQAES